MGVKIKLLTNRQYANKQHPIVISICKNNRRRVISTHFTCSETLWNKQTNLPKQSHPRYKFIKDKIESLKDHIAANLEEYLENKNNNQNIYLFKFIEELKKDLTHGNYLLYKALLRKFQKFNKRDVLIKEIDKNLINEYKNFFIKSGNTINGVSIQLRTLRSAINKANDKYNLNIINPFKRIKIENQRKDIPVINIEYLRKLKKLDLEGKEELVRDTFLFSFYCMGMNISNICYLSNSNIQENYIIYIREKLKNRNTKTIKIFITEPIREILNKWKNDSDYIFPIVKENPYRNCRNFTRYANKKLKKFSREINCPVSLTTNIARHIWAFRAVEINTPLHIIKEGLNHKYYKTTENYLDSIDYKTINESNKRITDI